MKPTMKALQLVRPRIFEQLEVPVPSLAPGPSEQLLIKSRWLSLCGSDISFFNGNKRYIQFPLPVGNPIHESVGEVVESQSSLFKPGEMVLAIPEGDQGLAEYYIALASKAVHLPKTLAEQDDSCLIQPLSTVLNAVDQLGELKGKSVAVVGLGSIGLFFSWLLKQRGAASITGIDPIPYRCQIAERLGATQTMALRSGQAVHTIRQAATELTEFDICIEAVGHQTQTLNDCLDLVKMQGKVLCFGVPDQPVYPIEYEVFFRKNAVLVAVVTPDWSDYLRQARELYQAHHAELAWMVSHRIPIKDATRAFSLYEQHDDNILKVILDASSWS
jgi:threonine dehydrogenase-like Zn-dependent dehydrogenase